MPYLDRTTEFFNIVEIKEQENAKFLEHVKLNGNNIDNITSNSNSKGKKKSNHPFFTEKSTELLKSLQTTGDLLKKLSKLVKQRSPFDENSDTIAKISVIIKQNLDNHTVTMKQLEDDLKRITAEKEQKKPSKSSKTHQEMQHLSTIVKSLDSRLRFTVEKFQNILKIRAKQVKKTNDRRSLFSHGKSNLFANKSLNLPPSPSNSENLPINQTSSPVLPKNPFTASKNTYSLLPNEEEHIGNHNFARNEKEISSAEEFNNFESQQQQFKKPNHALQRRTEEMEDIVRDLSSISTVFTRMADMIKEQGELTQRIDQNVTDALVNVEEGNQQLVSFLSKVSSNRGLILKAFFVIIIFVILSGIFIIR